MRDIAIYGAGGLGRETASALAYLFPKDEPRRFIGFFDDGKPKGEIIEGFGVCLGGIEELNFWPEPLEIALCFGDGHTTSIIYSKIKNPNISFPNLINSDIWFAHKESFLIGIGNIIHGKCEMSANIEIGNFNLFNGSVGIGHDVMIGDFNSFMPGCRISGEVKIGDFCVIGAMSFVKQQLKIGNGVHLSPLSPLLTKPKDNSTYIGNPAKLFKF